MNGRKLGEFYKEFFNHNYFRDIDYIRGEWWMPKPDKNGDHVRQWTDRVRYKVRNNTGDLKSIESFKKKNRYFLVDKRYRDGYGQLVHHNSYFRSVPDFHNLNNADRIYDRLFYDIDKHDAVINGFKNEIKRIKAEPIGDGYDYSYKQKLKDINDVHKEYQDYLFTTDFLQEPFQDAMKVINYYHERGTEPVLIFTGGAGFHLNVFFNPVHLKHPQEMALSYLNLIGDKCGIPVDDPNDEGISNLDPAVSKNAVNGNQRTPYSVHDKSGLTGFIVPDDTSYDDLMALIKKNRPNVPSDFSYDDHLVPDLLREQIIKMDGRAGQKTEEKRKQRKQQYNSPVNKTWVINVDGIGEVTVGIEHNVNLKGDLRQVWDLLVADGMAESPKDKDIREHYNRVRCPFPDHEDRNPSAICGKYRFKCFKCCPDGINWYMLIAVTYGIVDINDVKKDITQEQKEEIRKIIRKLTGKTGD